MARFVGLWMLVGALAFAPCLRGVKRWLKASPTSPVVLVSHPELGPEELKERLKGWGRKIPSHFDFEALILALNEAEARYGVDSDLLLAIAAVESAFNTEAVSSKNALGLFQIQPPTAAFLWPAFGKTLEAGDPLLKKSSLDAVLDVRGSTLLAAYYLSVLRNTFSGHTHLALASYNVGPGALKKAQKEGQLLGSTYVYRVYAIFRDLKADRSSWM